jgi:hypothetical protein
MQWKKGLTQRIGDAGLETQPLKREGRDGSQVEVKWKSEEKRKMLGFMEEVKREMASKQESCGDQRKKPKP